MRGTGSELERERACKLSWQSWEIIEAFWSLGIHYRDLGRLVGNTN